MECRLEGKLSTEIYTSLLGFGTIVIFYFYHGTNHH